MNSQGGGMGFGAMSGSKAAALRSLPLRRSQRAAPSAAAAGPPVEPVEDLADAKGRHVQPARGGALADQLPVAGVDLIVAVLAVPVDRLGEAAAAAGQKTQAGISPARSALDASCGPGKGRRPLSPRQQRGERTNPRPTYLEV